MECHTPNYGIEWFDADDRECTFRKKGPAVITYDGCVYFSQLSKWSYNRLQGPSTIGPDGAIEFNTTGQDSTYLHRTDGPARVWPDGAKIYIVHNKVLSPEEFFTEYGVL